MSCPDCTRTSDGSKELCTTCLPSDEVPYPFEWYTQIGKFNYQPNIDNLKRLNDKGTHRRLYEILQAEGRMHRRGGPVPYEIKTPDPGEWGEFLKRKKQMIEDALKDTVPEFCCERFKKATEADPFPGIDINEDKTYSVTGCCGHCYTLQDLIFCPFCGKDITKENGSDPTL